MRIGFFVVFAVMCISSETRLRAQLALDGSEICSHFSIPIANAEAIRQGDVLIRETRFFDSINGYNFDREGIVLQATTYYRVVFDFDKDCFACYKNEKKEVSSFGLKKKIRFYESVEQDGNKQVSILTAGFCFDGQREVLMREFPSGIIKKNRNTFSNEQSQFLFQVGFRDYRFPLGNFEGCPKGLRRGKEMFSRLATGDQLLSHKLLPKDVLELQMVAPKINLQLAEGQKLNKVTSVFQFNLLDSSVISMDGSRIEIFDENGVTRVAQCPTSYTWMLVNNVQVVKSQSQTQHEEFTTFGGDVFKAPTKQSVDFHWFSVNEPVEASFFDGSVLKTKENTLSVLDPQTNEAPDLVIEEMKFDSRSDSKPAEK